MKKLSQILAEEGLVAPKVAKSLPTQLRLSDLDEYEVSPSGTFRWTKWEEILPSDLSVFRTKDHMKVPFPDGTTHTVARRSTYPGSVFYLSTDYQFFIVVSRGKAFIRNRVGGWNPMLAYLSAKEDRSYRSVAKSIQEGWDDWVPLATVR